MFRRPRRHHETPIEVPETTEITPTHDDTPRDLGSVALEEQEQTLAPTGFATHESGLLIPDGSATVEISTDKPEMRTDSRRNTLETVEAAFKAEQERLRTALTIDEKARMLDIAEAQAREHAKGYSYNNGTQKSDADRNVAAIYRLKQMLKGDLTVYGQNVVKPGEDVSTAEVLQRIVDQYASLIPENYGNDSYIQSMGGTVKIADDGEVHCQGYNGSILYEFGRAKQIWDKMEQQPQEVREKIVEASDPDSIWLFDEPVIVVREHEHAA